MNTKPKKQIAVWLFFPPLIFIIALCIWVLNDPVVAGEQMAFAFSFVTETLAWYFEWYILAIVAVCVYLCVSPIGKKRFGNCEPEFSTFSWLGMIFTAVAGLGILTWSSFEWYYYAADPLWGIEPFSVEAYRWAAMYPLFHWGPVAYAIATLMGVFFAYQLYCKKIEDIRPSTFCSPVIGEKLANGFLGKLFDAIFAIGLLCSVVTCVGVNAPTFFGIFSRITGSYPSFSVQAIIILAWSALMAVLLFTGLKKGVKFLSDFRVWVGFGILIFLLVFGPTSTILNMFTDSVGMFIQNSASLILNTDSIAKSGTPQAWTIFYWCWYIVLAVQTGIFFAKVSKGRTVRELIIGGLLTQTIGSWLFFAVFQNFNIYTFMENGASLDLANILATDGQGAAIVALWDYFPFANFLYPVLIVYAFISMQTLLNGQCYSMAMVTTKELKNDEEPPIWLRIFWSLGIGAIAICLLLIGGIAPAQTVSIVSSVPITIIIAIMIIGFLKEIKQGWVIKDD